MRSDAATPEDYIAAAPEAWRADLALLRAAINAALPEGYAETMRWGMICWEVSLATCPATYNGQPLMYAGLAAQARHIGVHLCGLYVLPDEMERFRGRLMQPGRRLDMGKACLRVKRAADLDLAVLAEAVAAVPPAAFVAAAQRQGRSGPPSAS